MYVNWMSVYIILSCYSMWKYLVHSVFGSEILYGRLCVGWIVVLITFKPSNNIIISLLIKKKKNLIIPETQLQTKKNVVSKSVISWMLWSFWTEKKKFLCRQLSVFSSWDTCTSFVYILFHGDFSLPAMKFWPLSQLWRRLWAGSDKSYLLSYVEIYIKLNSSGFLCQFEEKSKVTNRMDMETYPTWSPSTTISQTGHPCFDVHHPVLMSTVIYFFL